MTLHPNKNNKEVLSFKVNPLFAALLLTASAAGERDAPPGQKKCLGVLSFMVSLLTAGAAGERYAPPK